MRGYETIIVGIQARNFGGFKTRFQGLAEDCSLFVLFRGEFRDGKTQEKGRKFDGKRGEKKKTSTGLKLTKKGED
jgi:hypothetical protein